MSDRAATILAGAIALLALAYFLTHIHAVTGPNGMVIYNTITGQERLASP
jgi:hypothetical protein